MSDDLVERLRGWRGYHQANLSVEAADRIEALTADRENRLADLRIIKAERDRLREALMNCARFKGMCGETARDALKGGRRHE